jgi:hypothetical protein
MDAPVLISGLLAYVQPHREMLLPTKVSPGSRQNIQLC